MSNNSESVSKRKIVNYKKVYKKICSYCGKEVTYNHSHKPLQCPYCEALNWAKPPTETQLFLYQRDYLSTRNDSILTKMYPILVSYVSSIMKKTISSSYIYDVDFIEEKSSDAATILIENYLSKPEFYIHGSFAGYLRDKVKEVLYSNKEEEDHDSLNGHFEDNDKELIEYSNRYNYQPLFTIEVEDSMDVSFYKDKDMLDGLMSILDRVFDELKITVSYYEFLATIVATLHRITKQSDEFMSRYYTEYGTGIHESVKKIEYLLFSFLKEYHQ